MNLDTAMLYKLRNEESMKDMEKQAIKEMEERRKEFEEAFKQVPSELEEEAARELNGKDCTKVDMTKNTPLTNWANKERKKLKKKRKLAKKSKQRNRK